MITRFRVQNYKALRDVTLDLTPIHVLIGPNDTGKTSILEAFSAFCRSVDHRMSDAFAGGWTGRRLVWCGQANLPIVFDAVIEGGNGPCEYSLFCSFGADGRDVRIFEESIEASDGRVVASWQADRTSSNVRELASEGLPGLNEASRATRHVYESLKGVHLYRWNPEFLRLPVAPDSKRRFRMAPSGFGLAQCLDEILGDDRERFAELERRFRSIFPYVNSIKLVHEPAYHARSDECHGPPVLREAEGKGLYFDIEGLDNLLPASQVSDGVLLVLAYLCILCLPEPPRVLLVEEPENGVHPRWPDALVPPRPEPGLTGSSSRTGFYRPDWETARRALPCWDTARRRHSSHSRCRLGSSTSPGIVRVW